MMRPAAVLAALLLLAGCRPELREAPDPLEGEPPVTQVTGGRAGSDRDPEVSPDGRRVFYASSAFGGTLDLFVKEVGSNTATRITHARGDERFPRLNPANPRMLAFCSDASGEWQIYVIEDFEKDPARWMRMTEPGSHNLHPSWSPDGSSIVYCTADEAEAGEWTLAVRDLGAGRTHLLEGVDGLLPEWSPAGGRIVFQRMRHRDRWLGSIWTLDFSGGSARDVTAVFASDDWAAINPSWSPDGRRIVFATVAKSRASSGALNEADDLWIVGADGSLPTRLTTSPAADWMPTWSGDGRIYFVSRRDGSDRIWSLRP